MIDAGRAPFSVFKQQFGDREIVDLVCESLVGRYPKRALHLGQDGTHVGHGDNVATGMGCQDLFYAAVHAICDLIPRLTRRRADETRVIPKSVQFFLILNFVELLHLPIAKLEFPKVRVMGQTRAIPGDGIRSGDGADQVG